MTIAEKLQKISDIKADIKTAINNKGVEVTASTPFEEYPDKIAQISGWSEGRKYLPFDGSIDEDGLREIGWTEDDIDYFKNNGGLMHYIEDDYKYVVNDAAKQAYAIRNNFNDFIEFLEYGYDEETEEWHNPLFTANFMPKLPYPVLTYNPISEEGTVIALAPEMCGMPNSNTYEDNYSDKNCSNEFTIGFWNLMVIPYTNIHRDNTMTRLESNELICIPTILEDKFKREIKRIEFCYKLLYLPEGEYDNLETINLYAYDFRGPINISSKKQFTVPAVSFTFGESEKIINLEIDSWPVLASYYKDDLGVFSKMIRIDRLKVNNPLPNNYTLLSQCRAIQMGLVLPYDDENIINYGTLILNSRTTELRILEDFCCNIKFGKWIDNEGIISILSHAKNKSISPTGRTIEFNNIFRKDTDGSIAAALQQAISNNYTVTGLTLV